MNMARIFKRTVPCAALAVMTSAVLAQAVNDTCDVDLSKPVEAYICSDKQLGSAKKQLAKQLAATVEAFPNQAMPSSGILITKKKVRASQVAWSQHVQLQCGLIADLPGASGDWHFSAANRNLCEVEETVARTKQLEKWRICATEGGGACLP